MHAQTKGNQQSDNRSMAGLEHDQDPSSSNTTSLMVENYLPVKWWGVLWNNMITTTEKRSTILRNVNNNQYSTKKNQSILTEFS